MKTTGRPAPAHRWLVWLIVLTGVVLPWSVGAAVKVYLDSQGMPTWPWTAFLNPLQLPFLLPATAWISLPFFVLAGAAYKLLPRDFAGLVTPASRAIFFGGGLLGAAFGAARTFLEMFWVFHFEELLTPVWVQYLPHTLLGLGIGYLVGRLGIHGPPAAHS